MEQTSTDTHVTLNAQGRSVAVPNEIMQEFIDFAKAANFPVLDIGAAFGVATFPALKNGAIVIANDIDQAHLDRIYKVCPNDLKNKLILKPGSFLKLSLNDESLSAILASQVLHFLTSQELIQAAQLMYSWLVPGGVIFTISGTVYTQNLQKAIPLYELRKKEGALWPGELQNIQSFAVDSTLKELPSFFHALDPEVLKRTFEAAGFQVIRCEFFARKGVPDYIKWDGRENVVLIAKKPN